MSWGGGEEGGEEEQGFEDAKGKCHPHASGSLDVCLLGRSAEQVWPGAGTHVERLGPGCGLRGKEVGRGTVCTTRGQGSAYVRVRQARSASCCWTISVTLSSTERLEEQRCKHSCRDDGIARGRTLAMTTAGSSKGV